MTLAETAQDSDSDRMVIDSKMIVFSKEDVNIVTLTPDNARRLLERNRNNRKVNRNNIAKLIRHIQSGTFVYNGSSVVISKQGRFIDGQHRLHACIETDTPIRVVIATGAADESQRNIGVGKNRTLANELESRGEKEAIALSAAIIGVMAWEVGERSSQVSGRALTMDEYVEFFERHSDKIRDLTRFSHRTSKKVPGLTLKAVAQLSWAFDTLDNGVEDRTFFFDKLASGAGMDEGDPILALRNMLIKDERNDVKRTGYFRNAVVCKAWNAFRDGEPIKLLMFKPGGARPESFPEPH